MWLEDHFGSGSQRNERVKLAASFWNNVGAGMVIGGLAAAFFLDKPSGTWTKIAIAIVGFVLGWLCYSIASNMLTYLHTAPEDLRLRGGL
jgi:F0F1-type ATP synthase assembly protein I